MKVLAQVRKTLGEVDGHEWHLISYATYNNEKRLKFEQRPVLKTIDLQTVLDAGLDVELSDLVQFTGYQVCHSAGLEVQTHNGDPEYNGYTYWRLRIPQLIDHEGRLEIEGVELENMWSNSHGLHVYKVIGLKPNYKYEWEKS